MNAAATPARPKLRVKSYWWLWVLDTGLVTGAFLFFLATRYGTFEFFGRALLMALLPIIPVMVLVGGAGSTIFVLSKVLVEKRRWNKPKALTLLVGQALVVALPLMALGLWKSPAHRLSYICAGCAPGTAAGIHLTGYSGFLREEWLAMFHTDEASFQKMIADAGLVPVDESEFKQYLEDSSLKNTKLFQQIPSTGELKFYRRIFRESTEHERGSVWAAYDPTTSAVVVFRGYRD